MYKRQSEKAAKLDALSPLKVLSRGYSFCEKDGQAIHSVSQVASGDALTLYFADGRVDSNVTSVTHKRDEE